MSDNEEWGYWWSNGKSHVWNPGDDGGREAAERLRAVCVKLNAGCVRGPVQRRSDPNPFEVKSPAAVDVAVAVDDSVSHPKHYTWLKGVEAIDLCEQMNYNLGAAVKYIVRCDHKGNWKQDLEKALWYLNREIARREKQK